MKRFAALLCFAALCALFVCFVCGDRQAIAQYPDAGYSSACSSSSGGDEPLPSMPPGAMPQTSDPFLAPAGRAHLPSYSQPRPRSATTPTYRYQNFPPQRLTQPVRRVQFAPLLYLFGRHLHGGRVWTPQTQSAVRYLPPARSASRTPCRCNNCRCRPGQCASGACPF